MYKTATKMLQFIAMSLGSTAGSVVHIAHAAPVEVEHKLVVDAAERIPLEPVLGADFAGIVAYIELVDEQAAEHIVVAPLAAHIESLVVVAHTSPVVM